MGKTISILLLLTIMPLFAVTQSTNEFFIKTDDFLKAHISNGKVDYLTIKKDPSELIGLLEMAKEIQISKNKVTEYQAFWINSYNLLVIQGIVEKYPVKSPLDIPGFFDKTKHEIGGEKITLNDIENRLLRGNFPNEPRFHFVLVCAGLGCPPIISSAYIPLTLDSQLQEQTTKALNDPNFIRASEKKVMVSQIFEWYKGDFTQNGQSLIDFINQYRKEKLPENSKISYYPYDWALNEIK